MPYVGELVIACRIVGQSGLTGNHQFTSGPTRRTEGPTNQSQYPGVLQGGGSGTGALIEPTIDE